MATIRRAGFGSVFEVENETVGIGTTGTAVNTVQVFGNFESPNANIVAQAQLENYQGFLDNKARISSNNADVNKLQGYVSGEAYYGASHIHNRDDGSQVKMVGAAHTTKKHSVIDDSSNFKSGTMGDVIIDGDFTVSSGTTYCSSVDKLTSVANFTVPTGNTDDRIHCHTAGSMRFNEDLGTLEFYTGDEWKTVNSFKDTGNRGRAVIHLGTALADASSKVEFLNISTFGNSQNFGDLTVNRYLSGRGSSETRGLHGGGQSSPAKRDVIDYYTIASEGDAIDFGNLTTTGRCPGGASSSTRALFAGVDESNVISYVQISTLGDALDFGDLTNVAGNRTASFSSPTRFVCMSGHSSPNAGIIEFVSIASKGNTTRFGNLTYAGEGYGGAKMNRGLSNSVRGLFVGGYQPNSPYPVVSKIDYVTIASEGNATNFGDMTSVRYNNMTTGSQTRGILAGGQGDQPSFTAERTIDSVEYATTGTAVHFGELSIAANSGSANSDSHGGLGGF